MVWKEVSPGIFTGYYQDWHITKIILYTDVYKKDHLQFVAISNDKKFTATNWEAICTKILNTKQFQLFEL